MAHLRSLARAVALTAALTAPVAVVGQAPVERPATHTVKPGDTLWDLAALYLGDPFQWPQIYELNKDLIKDPHWIYPNQVFRIPGGTAAGAAAPAEPAPAAGPARRRSSMTVFNPAMRRAPEGSTNALLARAPRTAVRPGDYETAPFMWVEGGPMGGGRIDGTAESVGIAMTAALRPMQIREEVMITTPRGWEGSVGSRLLAYRLGEIVPGQGQVVVPTGVVQVSRLEDATHARAIVMNKYEDVFAGNGLTVLDTLAMPVNVFPSRVEFGLSTRVSWVYSKPALAGRGQHLIVAATGSQGLVTGDQISLRVSRQGDLPGDVEVAVAQVTRVTPWGVSAIVLDVSDAGVTAGTRAQVSAKMP